MDATKPKKVNVTTKAQMDARLARKQEKREQKKNKCLKRNWIIIPMKWINLKTLLRNEENHCKYNHFSSLLFLIVKVVML